MPYTPDKPNPPPSREELKARIPDWGADLDPADRPAVPKEQFIGSQLTIADRQIPRWNREKSLEHAQLTPVFGTSCPPKGLSGVLRKLAYRRWSEGQSAHWLLLVLADRIDVLESLIGAALRLRPDNPVAEMGLKAEVLQRPLRSRLGQHRNDVKRIPLDIATVALTWGLPALAIAAAVRALRTNRRHARLMRPKVVATT